MVVYKILIVCLFLLVNWGLAGQTLHLVTEDYPPFNMRASNQRQGSSKIAITGIATDIVSELFKRSGYKYTLKILPWKRAYHAALAKPNYGVFSTTRTQKREKLFQWVGPLVKNNWVFLSKKDRKFKIHSIQEAKKYRVGGYQGDAVALYLGKDFGFEMQLTSYDHLNAHKLANNRIDLWATGHLLGPYLARMEKVRGLETVYMFKETVMSIAFNKSVSPEIIVRLNRILKQMKRDGAVRKIHKRYR